MVYILALIGWTRFWCNYTPAPRRGRGILFYLCPSFRPSKIFFVAFFNSCWEKCDEKWAYMFNVYKNQQSRQTGSRNPMGSKTLPTIWGTYMTLVDFVDFSTHWTYMLIFRHIFLSNYWWQKSDIWSQALYRYPISWEAFFDPSDSYFLFAKEWGYHRWALAHSYACNQILNFCHQQLLRKMRRRISWTDGQR
jgi:hypothetical protein